MTFRQVVDVIGWYKDDNSLVTIFTIFMLLCDLVKNFKDDIFELVNLVKSDIRKSVVFEENRVIY